MPHMMSLFVDRMQAVYQHQLDLVLNGVHDDLNKVILLIAADFETEQVKNFIVKATSAFGSGDLPAMLELATSKQCKDSYSHFKHIDNARDDVAELGNLKGAAVFQREVQALDLEQKEVKKLAGMLTAIQTLGRQLKIGETRQTLCKRCRTVLKDRGMWALLPPHLAAQVDKASGPSGGAAARAEEAEAE